MRPPHDWECPVCFPQGWTPKRAVIALAFIALVMLVTLVVMIVR